MGTIHQSKKGKKKERMSAKKTKKNFKNGVKISKINIRIEFKKGEKFKKNGNQKFKKQK